MARARFTRNAHNDLRQLIRFIGRDNPTAALRTADQIRAACRQLGRDPFIGIARGDLATGVRMLPVGNYLIFYRPVNGVQILRIIHGAREYGVSDFDL